MFKLINKLLQITLITCVLLLSSSPIAFGASEVTSLDNLKVSFWPEYDHKDPRKSVLVIYRGSVTNGTELPAEIKFPIPKGSEILAATSVDPSGRLITKSYDLRTAGDLDELVYEIDSLDFQFEFYNFSTGTTKERDYSFPIRLPMAVKKLQVEIQEPLEATGFTIDPPSSDVSSRREQSNKSFDYHSYVISDLSPNSSIDFNVSYNKPDTRPSVDIQLGATTNIPKDSKGRPWFITAVISALIILIIAIFLIAKRFRSPSRSRFGKGFKVSDHVKIRDDNLDGFCIKCGQPLKKGEKYCSACGADI